MNEVLWRKIIAVPVFASVLSRQCFLTMHLCSSCFSLSLPLVTYRVN